MEREEGEQSQPSIGFSCRYNFHEISESHVGFFSAQTAQTSIATDHQLVNQQANYWIEGQLTYTGNQPTKKVCVCVTYCIIVFHTFEKATVQHCAVCYMCRLLNRFMWHFWKKPKIQGEGWHNYYNWLEHSYRFKMNNNNEMKQNIFFKYPDLNEFDTSAPRGLVFGEADQRLTSCRQPSSQ